MSNRREERQLFRLQNLTDVIFAIVLWRLFTRLPSPTSDDVDSAGSLLDFLVDERGSFAVILIGLLLVVIYWLQSNALFGSLVRTNARHAVGSIIQLFFLLFYLWANKVGMEFEDTLDGLFIQSVALALLGFTAWSNFRYASKAGLLSSDVSPDEAWKLRRLTLCEPLTALATVPFCWLGSDLWTLSWLLFVPINMFLARLEPRFRGRGGAGS